MWKSILMLICGLLAYQLSLAQYSGNIKVETLLKTDTTYIGQPLMYPDVKQAEITVLKITMNPGSSTGWHKLGVPLFAYILAGELTVEREDGRTNTFKKGQAISEILHFYHQGTNKGNHPTILIAFYLGGDNKPLVTIKLKS